MNTHTTHKNVHTHIPHPIVCMSYFGSSCISLSRVRIPSYNAFFITSGLCTHVYTHLMSAQHTTTTSVSRVPAVPCPQIYMRPCSVHEVVTAPPCERHKYTHTQTHKTHTFVGCNATNTHSTYMKQTNTHKHTYIHTHTHEIQQRTLISILKNLRVHHRPQRTRCLGGRERWSHRCVRPKPRTAPTKRMQSAHGDTSATKLRTSTDIPPFPHAILAYTSNL